MNTLEETKKIRRYLHMYPELGFDLEGTAQYIETYLNSVGITTKRTAETAVTAYIKGKDNSKPVLAIRSDMDACPIQEENGFEFKSKLNGAMHACGHDGHIAILLCLAKFIKERKFTPDGHLKLIFQPAEENGKGAKALIAAGILEDVNTIIGYHLWPDLEPGIIQINRGAQMAGSDRFKIILTGQGGHGAYPAKAVNPINGAVEICREINKLLSRLKISQYASLSIGKIESGTSFNVIPEVSLIEGSLRTLSLNIRELIIKELKSITNNIAEQYKLKSEFCVEQIAPVLFNDPEVARLIEKCVKSSDQRLTEKNDPVFASEDFGFYLQKKSGAFFFIGARKSNKDIFLHNPNFDFEESAMPKGVEILMSIINEYWKASPLCD